MSYSEFLDRTVANHHRIPHYRLRVITQDENKKDITTLISHRLMSMTIADNRGFEADEIDIQLSDHDGKLAFPRRGAMLEVAIGWQGEQLIPKGKFIVDELQYSGSPDSLTLRARSADLRGSLSDKKERSFDNISFENLINQIAKENQLEGACAEAFKEKVIPHLDQTNESDINLLSRLAENYDAIATVKNGKLLFMPVGMGLTVSGKALPTIEITRQMGDNFSFSLTENDNYTAVRAYWHNMDNGKKGVVLIDKNTKIERLAKPTHPTEEGGTSTETSKTKKKVTLVQTQPVETDSNKMKTLRHTYKTEAYAINAAKAAFDKMRRGIASLSINLADGNAWLMPELRVRVSGFKDQIDSSRWIISKVTHNLTTSGFTTSLELELDINGGEEK
ncbi:contractile injection system protein, VgrG/Pvc8 family [Histophilus somni]|uniref:Phage late control D family protein n=1 Tax=Histophilus somni TaxID=731 RepID=A0AAX2S1A4_HISSO|nr:contractile injection system protein, VgrG/Pvc8 family [Histophilus somni]TDF37985.1 phage late control D family protein [Histophilus somni]TEW27316.1 phage late control D family protein [Histophilus somni]THA89296.1 phage late control D family protein [Histophilus somni]TJY48100.1 phage late control D family protein [Histophilus somni]